ncbi:hypothetical protein Droror1_Dr00016103 [Drosera rotundifolia]
MHTSITLNFTRGDGKPNTQTNTKSTKTISTLIPRRRLKTTTAPPSSGDLRSPPSHTLTQIPDLESDHNTLIPITRLLATHQRMLTQSNSNSSKLEDISIFSFAER